MELTKEAALQQILAAYERNIAEAQEFARNNRLTYVVCLNDTTPFRVADGGRIQLLGQRIYSVIRKLDAQRVADNLTKQLLANTTSKSTAIVMAVADWARERQLHLETLSNYVRNA